MNIAFGMDSLLLPPLGKKDTVIKLWGDSTMKKWQKIYDRDPDKLHVAVNTHFFGKGGKEIGKIRLIDRPLIKNYNDISMDDFLREGSPYDSYEQYMNRFLKNKKDTTKVIVIRFSFQPNEYFSKLASDIIETKAAIERQEVRKLIMNNEYDLHNLTIEELEKFDIKELIEVFRRIKGEFNKLNEERSSFEAKLVSLNLKIKELSENSLRIGSLMKDKIDKEIIRSE